MRDDEPKHTLGDRFLDRMAVMISKALQGLHMEGRKTPEIEAAHFDKYMIASRGPARRGLDVIERAADGNATSWREPTLPGLKPSPAEAWTERSWREYSAQKDREAADRIDRIPGNAPVTYREGLARQKGPDFADELLDRARESLNTEGYCAVREEAREYDRSRRATDDDIDRW